MRLRSVAPASLFNRRSHLDPRMIYLLFISLWEGMDGRLKEDHTLVEYEYITPEKEDAHSAVP